MDFSLVPFFQISYDYNEENVTEMKLAAPRPLEMILMTLFETWEIERLTVLLNPVI